MTNTNTAIKPHYKQTQLGRIPVEWEVLKVKDICKSFSGGTPSRSKPEYYRGNIHWIKSGELNQGIITTTSEFITEEGLSNSSAKLIKPGTLLVAMYGATAGVVAISKIEGAINQAVLALILDNKANLLFLYDYLKMRMPRIVKSLVQGGQPNLSGGIINNLKVALPPLPEQQKIATILSTWDRAIAQQQQLIAAKQQFKKGLMQRLLTGKQRFEGFEGEWEEVRLGELGIVQTGNTPSKKNQDLWGGEFYWSTAEDMDEKYINDTNQKLTLKGKTKARIAKRGSVLVTCIASIGKNSIANVDTGFNQQINAISTNEYFDNEFVYYLLDFHPKKLLQFAGAGAMPMLNKNTFMSIKFRFPKIEEQQKIASVLSAADQEIALLQKQLTQLQAQKQGLMQGLLTGVVRVKI